MVMFFQLNPFRRGAREKAGEKVWEKVVCICRLQKQKKRLRKKQQNG